jgi:hypothetical protein
MLRMLIDTAKRAARLRKAPSPAQATLERIEARSKDIRQATDKLEQETEK